MSLKDNYIHTTYRLFLFGQQYNLTPRQKTQLPWIKLPNHIEQLVVITSVNPRSKLLSTLENAKRLHQLEEQISESGLIYCHSLAVALREPWPDEPGFGVFSDQGNYWRPWAQKYDQNAVLVCQRCKNVPDIIWV